MDGGIRRPISDTGCLDQNFVTANDETRSVEKDSC